MSVNIDIERLNSIFKKYHVDKCWHMSAVHGNKQAKEILSMFGGMGSVNDIYICKVNKNPIDEEMESEVNSEARCLLNIIYKKCGKYALHISKYDCTKKSKSNKF